jgi:hypothetical protein
MRGRLVVTTLSLLIVGAFSFALTLESSTPQYDAVIEGHLLISGGPAPGSPRPSDGEITATKNENGKSYSVSVPSTGEFTLQLPAGRYSLTGSSPQFGNGQYKCFAARTVTVFKGETIHEDVFCSEM